MPSYAVVALQRIQTYLARSRRLWGRRGASEELVRLTTLPNATTRTDLAIPALLSRHADVSLEPEALDIDGVVVLTADDLGTVKAAARDLAMTYQRALPAVTVENSWWLANRYTDTLGTEPDGRERYLPGPYEYPVARLCDECATSAATTMIQRNGTLRLCTDCANRAEAEDAMRQRAVVRSSAANTNRFDAERWLQDQLAEDPQYVGISSVRDFTDLGRIQLTTDRPTRSTTDNHTALVFADGNGLGAMFEAARAGAKQRGTTAEMRSLSKRIKKGTFGSVLQATKAITLPGAKELPVIPHIVGGDDVLVSITADHAWKWLTTFLETLRDSLAGDPISMSAGVLICKSSFPFGQQVELAEELLRKAKQDVAGRDWSFAWLDVTNDGPNVVAERPSWTLDDLHRRSDALDAMADLEPSSQSSIKYCLDQPDRMGAELELHLLAQRLPSISGFLNKLPRTANNEFDQQVILDTLSLGRWWR